jgi:hypothetical protein
MLYFIFHFLHHVGALGIAATYAIEAATLVGLRRSADAHEARVWFRARRWVLVVGPPSIGVVLATGLYTIFVGWGWQGWIVISLASVVALALIGGVLTGIPMGRLAPILDHAGSHLSNEIRSALKSRTLSISIATRIGMTVGIVFLMVKKPEPLPALLVMAIAVLVGVGVGFALGVSRRSLQPVPSTGEAGRA